MQHKNNRGKTVAVAGLAAALIFGFVIVPKLIANPPEAAGINSVVSSTDPLAVPGAAPEDTSPGPAGEDTEPGSADEETEPGPDDEHGNTSGLVSYAPGINHISLEQAFESAVKTLNGYGYDVAMPDTIDPSDEDFRKEFYVIYDHRDDLIYDPLCVVYLKHDLEIPGEIDIQEYMDSEAFKGMSEAEIREIIEADDLSTIKYKAGAQHPKFKVLDGESCTIYFRIELNALTGEAQRGFETRVRLGEELSFGEANYFGTPIWESDGYYDRLYY